MAAVVCVLVALAFAFTLAGFSVVLRWAVQDWGPVPRWDEDPDENYRQWANRFVVCGAVVMAGMMVWAAITLA